MTLLTALNRTLLLMRDDVRPDATDAELLASLTSTTVVLSAAHDALSTHSGQSAFVTAATLMARSGHTIYLDAPDVALLGPQPPLNPGRLLTELMKLGSDLLPSFEFRRMRPSEPVDLLITLGAATSGTLALRTLNINATRWSATVVTNTTSEPWRCDEYPFGALAAGVLAAGEAFKVAMRKLAPRARDAAIFRALFAPVDGITVRIAPEGTPLNPVLGQIDCISGGAITSAFLYSTARIPGVAAFGRIFEPDTADTSNLNRYALLRRSAVPSGKAAELARMLAPRFVFEPIKRRVDSKLLSEIGELAKIVLVGVDHIPSRWAVQQAKPSYLVVGATTHWSAMASFHESGLGCAQCLHPTDDPTDAPIPTVAFVSFWAGLLSAALVARRAAGRPARISEQQVFFTPFRPETPYRAPVHVRDTCPTCQRRAA